VRYQELLEENHLGLVLNKQKCCILLGSEGLTPKVCAMKARHRLQLKKGLIEMLGTVVSRDPVLIENFMLRKFRKWGLSMELLLAKDMPAQAALGLARSIACQRPVFDLRAQPPVHTLPAAVYLDRKVQEIVEKKLEVKFDTDFALHMFRAPYRQGGLAFTSLEDTRIPAFLGSTYQTIKDSKKGTVVRTLARSTLEQLPTMVQVKHDLATLTSEQLKGASLKNPCTLTSFISKAKQDKDTKTTRLQSALQTANADSAWSEAYSKASPRQRAHLNARLNPYASAALRPTENLVTGEYRLNQAQTQFLVAHATMVTPGKVPAACSCGHALDATHMLCCKHGDSAWLLRHNKVQQVLAGFARKQGLAVDQNVRKSFEDAEIKSQNFEPDLIVYFQDQALWGDVSIVEPVAPSNVRGNDNVGDAMDDRARTKNRKYLARARSMGADFAPLVVETHGRFHAEFTKLLKRLAIQLDGYHGITAREMAVIVNLEVVKGNAEHAARVRSRAWKAWNKQRQRVH
jgi:hypothetical protein